MNGGGAGRAMTVTNGTVVVQGLTLQRHRDPGGVAYCSAVSSPSSSRRFAMARPKMGWSAAASHHA